MGMRRRPSPTADPEAQLTRFAWGIAFFATLTLVAVLGLARSAQAMTVPGVSGSPVAAALSASDGEDFEDEAEASEEEDFEAGECDEEEEECEEEDGESGAEAPAECLLTSAQASVLATNNDRVRLQIRYTTTSPTAVTVDYGLHGSKGGLFLGSEKKRFGRKGVLRLTESLTEPQMTKVMAAKGFTVRLRVPAAPRYCNSLFDRQLDVRQPTPSGLAWQQSE